MTNYDVFNGDADGLCALQQLRLASPVDSHLVTGVKRDISLLKRVHAEAGDQVTVLDISLEKNRVELERILAQGAQVEYIDHHYPGDIPEHPALVITVEASPDVCTSLLVNERLDGQFRSWAVVGAFGDNLDESAQRAAEPLGLSVGELTKLRELGICINYNAYGATVDDLFFPPDDLFRRLSGYADPLRFMAEDETFVQLKDGYSDDMARSAGLVPQVKSDGHAVLMLPGEPWARRVSGVLGNQLARDHPQRAHALLTSRPDGGYVVSVRAPLSRKEGADELCLQFPSGGGRKAAAGINHLPEDLLDDFVDRFRLRYP